MKDKYNIIEPVEKFLIDNNIEYNVDVTSDSVWCEFEEDITLIDKINTFINELNASNEYNGEWSYEEFVDGKVSIKFSEHDFRTYEHSIFHTSYKSFKESLKINELRHVTVYFTDGDKLNTSMAAHLTDEEIYNYYQKGKEFNIGSGENDLIKTVDYVVINENKNK